MKVVTLTVKKRAAFIFSISETMAPVWVTFKNGYLLVPDDIQRLIYYFIILNPQQEVLHSFFRVYSLVIRTSQLDSLGGEEGKQEMVLCLDL